MEFNRYLKIKTAAVYLGMSVKKLRTLTYEGRIPYIPGAGLRAPWLYDRADLDAYMQQAKRVY